MLLVLCAGYGVFGLGRAVAGGDPKPASVEQVVVQPGDSLWRIAERVMPGMDPRDAVGKIRALNHLPSGVIQLGQRLSVR